MKKILIFAMLSTAIMASCNSFSTRLERDVYTIADRDTLTYIEQKNAPGTRNLGIIYPSSRTFQTSRSVVQHDSVVEREYPDFIRLGIFESVGLIGSSSDYKAGVGLFGIFPDFDNIKSSYQGTNDRIFSGGIYRFGVGEWRLRWFRDAANWTIGTSMLEILMPEARVEKTLASIFPIQIKKRYYLSQQIPYIAVAPAVSFGYYPSQYANASVSLELGSIGGLNLRAYVGYAAGFNSKAAYQVRVSSNSGVSQTSAFPYIGLGMSFLDFHNIVPETLKEWKDHEHSSWGLSLFQASILSTGADSSALSDGSGSNPLSGSLIKIANAAVALPILNNKFYLGTSLANILVLGKSEWGLGILPIRLGYWQTILSDELSTEPFIEYNYYPSAFFHIGNRVNLKISNFLTLGIVMGYASGDTKNAIGKDLYNQFGYNTKFAKPYIGFSIGVADRIFLPEELRYNK